MKRPAFILIALSFPQMPCIGLLAKLRNNNGISHNNLQHKNRGEDVNFPGRG